MSQEETTAFLEAVGRELQQRGLPHELGDGTVRVERGGEWSDFGLSNLAQFCHHVGRRSWREAIATHFDNSSPPRRRRRSSWSWRATSKASVRC